MVNEKIRIRLKAYDHRILDQSTSEIVDTAKRTGARVAGPIPLPTVPNRWDILVGKNNFTYAGWQPLGQDEVVVPHAKQGAAILFAHGFPMRFGGVEPPAGLDVVMVAPMGPGLRLRRRLRLAGRLRSLRGLVRRGFGRLVSCARGLVRRLYSTQDTTFSVLRARKNLTP